MQTERGHFVRSLFHDKAEVVGVWREVFGIVHGRVVLGVALRAVGVEEEEDGGGGEDHHGWLVAGDGRSGGARLLLIPIDSIMTFR